MRLIDLLRPYLEGLERVVDRTPPSLDLRRYLLLPDGIDYERTSSTREPAAAGPGTLVLAVLGPDPDVHGDPETVRATIAALEPGGRAVILFGWDGATLPFHRILDPLSAAHCQVLQVAALDYERVPSAAVIEHVERLAPPRDALGEPVMEPPTDDAGRLGLGIRLANEHAFGDFAARAWRSTAAGSGGDVPGERFTQEYVRTQRQLEANVQRLEAQLVRQEESTSMRVGRTMVGAARSPRAAVRLPLDLFRIWRKRPS